MIVKHHFQYSLIILLSFCSAFAADEQENLTVYKKVMQQNLSSVSYEDYDCNSDRYYDYLVYVMNRQLNLQEFQKRRTLFLLLDKNAKQKKYQEDTVLQDTTTWKDLILFCGQTDLSHYLGAKIDRTKTAIGKVTLYSMLAQPSSDITTIERRQRIIKELVDNPILLQKLEAALAHYAESENMLMSTWTNDPLKQAIKKRYFNFSSDWINGILNNNSTLLNITSLFEHQTRIVWTGTALATTIILPIYALSKLTEHAMPKNLDVVAESLRDANPMLGMMSAAMSDNKVAVSSLAIAGSILASQSIRESYDWTADNFVLDTFLHAKMMHIANAIQAMKTIGNGIAANAILNSSLINAGAFNHLFTVQRQESPDIARLLSTLESDMFKEKPTLLSNRGKTLVGYNQFSDNKEEFNDIVVAIGELDMYVSLAKLYKECEHDTARYCFATFKTDTTPSIAMESFWNPCIDRTKVKCSSLSLGVDDVRNNMIITGPNAGGKSTVLKAITISIIMAQSFGIAPAQEFCITPFDTIMTYLNITDDIGSGNSLFKAQVSRAQHILDNVSSLPIDKKSFIVIDEMFNGTAPKEAQACAFSVAQELDKYTNNISIIATHYHLLTRLENESIHYRNYHVSVNHAPDGKLIYPFLLERGISHQHVALDILRNEGFNGSVVERAQAIVRENS